MFRGFSGRVLACAVLATVGGGGWGASTAQAAFYSYYIGVDSLPTIASGTYSGLPNPNHNRLTFLYAHVFPATPASNHYHSKGIKTYTGANLGASTAVVTSASDYVPEGTYAPLTLTAGSGLYAGKLVTQPLTTGDPAYDEFSHLTIGNTKSLAGFATGSGEAILFNSSAGRWNAAFSAADVHWELVSLTPGLHVGNASTQQIAANPGDDVHVGEGSEMFEFTPILWAEPTAAPGTYEAVFRLTDESGTFGNSGEIRLRTAVVPEPAGVGIVGMGAVALLRRVRRR